MNWSQPAQEHMDSDSPYHKNTNGIISDKLAGHQSLERRTYNSVELQNGSIYHSFNNNSQFNNTNDNQNSNNNTNNNNNVNNNHSNNSSNSNKKLNNNNNPHSPFIPTTTSAGTYTTNQSHSPFQSPPPQEYSLHDTNHTVNHTLSRQSPRPNSRSSPGRASRSPASSVKSEPMVTTTIPVNGMQSHHPNDQTLETEPFLVNTTTTMHPFNNNNNHSDLTTSMNTSTGNAIHHILGLNITSYQ
jgi:hypothetical protein